MCLAIYKPGGVTIPREHLVNGWQYNSDGAGFAYAHKGKVVIRKGFMKLQEFLTAYDAAVSTHSKVPFVIHFRTRSTGDKSSDNTHPFEFPGGVLIHNGTLNGTGADWNKGESDTLLFVKAFGKHFTYEMIHNHKKEWEEAVDENKIVLLYNNGDHIILNEGKGQWSPEGAWFSNAMYKYDRSGGYTGGGVGTHSGWRGMYGDD